MPPAPNRGTGRTRALQRAAVLPAGWAEHAIAAGAAGLAALATDTALRMHSGLAPAIVDSAAAVVFAGLAVGHMVLRPRAVRVAPALKKPVSPKRVAEPARASVAPAPLDEMPVQLRPRLAETVVTTASDGFAHLQKLVAELARATPGPKAVTADPDAPRYNEPEAFRSADDMEWRPSAHVAALADVARTMELDELFQYHPEVAGAAAELTDALDAGRITVYLEPIQQIETDRTRHYEVSVRFKTADGVELPHHEMLAAARMAGLLPRVDAVVLPRAARIAQHFQMRGRDTEILSHVHGASLPDPDFRAEVTAATIAADGAALVLSFAQADVRGFGPIHWEILSTIADMGLRFAIEGVTDLDMDFEALKLRGFNFAKLDAGVLLDGLPAFGGKIAPADVCRHVVSAGLALIVNHIDDEVLLARLLGFGVLFGQGTLFGTRRAVRADLLSMYAAAAA